MCKVVAVCNQKGGVGKTTTTIHLCESLASMGKKVLIIELCSQGNLSMGLGVSRPGKLAITIATLLNHSVSATHQIEDVKQYFSSVNGIDFISANSELSNLEERLYQINGRESVLKKFIAPLKVDYEYIFIDCSPALNILTINALNASDEVIIPVVPEYFPAKGLESLLETIVKVKKKMNPSLNIAGIVLTMVDNKSKFEKTVMNIVSRDYDSLRIFESYLPVSKLVPKLQSQGKTTLHLEKNKVAIGYRNLAKEFLAYE